MDLSSLQQHGDNALALAHAFGAADIASLARPAAADATYFPALGRARRVIPDGWSGRSRCSRVLAVVALGFLARRRGLISWPRAAGRIRAGRRAVRARAGCRAIALARIGGAAARIREHDRPLVAGLVPGVRRCMVAAILLAWYALSRRRVGPWSLIVGALGLLAVARCGAGRGRPGRLVPGGAARPGRGAGRNRQRHGVIEVGAGGGGDARRRRRRFSSSRQRCRCSSRRWAWRPGPPPRCSR